VEAHLVNDGAKEVPGTLTLRALAFDGTERTAITVATTAPANAATGAPIAALPLAPDLLAQSADLFVHAVFTPANEYAGFAAENFLLLAEPKDLRLPDPGLTWEVTPNPRRPTDPFMAGTSR
jgi:hypothetical protein